MRLVTALGLALLPATAMAADLAPAPAPSPAPSVYIAPAWAGFYVGVNAGYGWSLSKENLSGNDSTSNFLISNNIIPNSLDTHAQGALVGGTVGYNWQLNRFVLGAEADMDWSDVKGNAVQTQGFVIGSLTSQASTRLDWLATVRARAGYLLTPTTLLYATGGAAFGHIKTAANGVVSLFNNTVATASGAASDTKAGWTVGGGLEQRLTQNWSLKVEYDYIHLGDVDSTVNVMVGKRSVPVSFTSTQPGNFNRVIAGVNYRF